MSNPTLTVTFTDGTTTITLRAPATDINAPTILPSISNFTQGGALVQFQVGQSRAEVTLPFEAFNDATAGSLRTFYTTNFGKDVTYTDAAGNTYTARFLDDKLPLRKVFKNHWSCSLHLKLSAALK